MIFRLSLIEEQTIRNEEGIATCKDFLQVQKEGKREVKMKQVFFGKGEFKNEKY